MGRSEPAAIISQHISNTHQVALQVAAAAPQVLAVLDDLQQQLDHEEDDATSVSACIFREALVLARRRIQAGQSQKSWAIDSLLPFSLFPSFDDAEEEEEGRTAEEVAATTGNHSPCTSSALLRRFRAHNPVGFSFCATPQSVHVAIGGVVPHALTGGSDPVHVVVAEATVRKRNEVGGTGNLHHKLLTTFT
jgi:hypothetical protein